jgi:hypothetical protein
MDRFIENLKYEAEQNPVMALGVAAGLITAVSKLMNARSDSRNARAWTREVARRAAKDKK